MLARLLLVCCAVSVAALPAGVRRGRPHKHLAASTFERMDYLKKLAGYETSAPRCTAPDSAHAQRSPLPCPSLAQARRSLPARPARKSLPRKSLPGRKACPAEEACQVLWRERSAVPPRYLQYDERPHQGAQTLVGTLRDGRHAGRRDDRTYRRRATRGTLTTRNSSLKRGKNLFWSCEAKDASDWRLWRRGMPRTVEGGKSRRGCRIQEVEARTGPWLGARKNDGTLAEFQDALCALDLGGYKKGEYGCKD